MKPERANRLVMDWLHQRGYFDFHACYSGCPCYAELLDLKIAFEQGILEVVACR